MTQSQTSEPASAADRLQSSSLLDALRGRRSRRFGAGMRIPSGPFTYQSELPPQPLSEDEEAALAFAGAGITGNALADVSFGSTQGGTMIAALLGRTVSSADAIQNVALVAANDEATYLMKRPADFAPSELPEIIDLAQRGDLTELYRKMRLKIKDGRAAPSIEPPRNFSVNHWSLYAKGATYFTPIGDVTRFYINGVMEMFDEGMDLFILDERAGFRPAGLAKFGKSRGGPLHDNTKDGRFGTIGQTETVICEMIAVEIGMMLQNIALMAQAIGLGAWPSFARHETAWFEALGFKMETMSGLKYLGAGAAVAGLARMMGKDSPATYPIALEVDGKPVLKPYTPPYFPSMRAAVRAVADEKFGQSGVFRDGAVVGAWQDPAGAVKSIPVPKDYVIDATAEYCQYIWDRYGRFPAHTPPFRTLLGSQVAHLDVDFYDKFFKQSALTDTQRSHQQRWHGGS